MKHSIQQRIRKKIMHNILILVTNQGTLGEAKEKNGTYAPELTHVLHQFMDANIAFDIASIDGGAAPLYGDDVDDGVILEVLCDDRVNTALANTSPLSNINPADYSAVFYPGGFGLLYDLAKSEAAGSMSAAIFENGGVIGAVCHGPAGLLPITLSNGENIMANITVTGFTHEEEKDFGTLEKIPYLLEESLTRVAGQYSKKAPWIEFVVEQGRVITGQNPQSATAVGKAMVAQLTQA
jgi:putative intracellular protease/amidase